LLCSFAHGVADLRNLRELFQKLAILAQGGKGLVGEIEVEIGLLDFRLDAPLCGLVTERFGIGLTRCDLAPQARLARVGDLLLHRELAGAGGVAVHQREGRQHVASVAHRDRWVGPGASLGNARSLGLDDSPRCLHLGVALPRFLDEGA
jgi:hypothetical protein